MVTKRSGRWIVVIVGAAIITAAGAVGYKRWPDLIKKFRYAPPAGIPTQDQLSAVPPFSTREPERYQAVRIIVDTQAATGQEKPVVTNIEKVLVARDGPNRREEVTNGTDTITVYIETLNEHLLLFPAKKLYSDLDAVSNSTKDDLDSNGTLDYSPERLLHEAPAVASYRLLGPEDINGRKTTKYRVASKSNDETNSDVVTFIWIDDEFGMPVKSETKSTVGTISTMELRDIRLDVNPLLFRLPNDYKRVDFLSLQNEISRSQLKYGQETSKSKQP